uniref:Glutathione peroxidase 1 n=1 Tax=Malurus cyaneus samueli TaxID=2593467 RepID=A0A8C5TB65_9PASS
MGEDSQATCGSRRAGAGGAWRRERARSLQCEPWRAAAAAGRAAGLAGLSARPLGAAEPLSLGSLKGKVLLVANVLNELQQRYGPRGLQVLGFPCNQFGHQENGTNDEILPMLEHVRPGNGYKPNFIMFEKCEVNGKNAHPVFTFLKEALPFPHDDPSSLMTNPQYIIWSPVCRNDIAWNFEKFLIGPDGVPFKRYSRNPYAFAQSSMRCEAPLCIPSTSQ